MVHIKGQRFGFPLVRQLGVLKHLGTYPVFWNKHTGLEIHYVLKGDIAWELEGMAEPFAVPGGYFGIIPAGTKHRAFGNKGTPAIRLGIIFDRPAADFAKGTVFTAADLKRIFKRFRGNGAHIRRFSSRLSSIARDLANAVSVEAVTEPDDQLRLRTLVSSLIHETYVTLGEPEALAAGHDVVPKIRRWIDTHCAENISIDKLVKISGYGRSRFFTLFLTDTGMTPNDYLVRKRIHLAKKRLSKKDMCGSMLDLAVACGFNSSSAFASTFRKHVGMSPREFHNQAMRAT